MFEISGSELINIVNRNINDDDKKIKSKFAIIIATAKRARQLVATRDERLEDQNALTVAINEFKEGKVNIINE